MNTWLYDTRTWHPEEGTPWLGNGWIGGAVPLDGHNGGSVGKRMASLAANYQGTDEVYRMAPHWLRAKIKFDGREAQPSFVGYRQTWDLRRNSFGTSYADRGGGVRVSTQTFCHREIAELAVWRVEVEALRGGGVEITPLLDAEECEGIERISFEKSGDGICAWTLDFGDAEMRVGQALALDVFREADVSRSQIAEANVIGERIFCELEAGGKIVVTAFVATCRGGAPAGAAREIAEWARDAGFDAVFARHQAAMEKFWRGFDVEAEDKFLERRLRGAMLYVASGYREDVVWGGTPAGLSGQNGWGNSVFWDTEFYIFPALLLTHPKLARNALLYRHTLLPGARANAAAEGFKGARFGWQCHKSGHGFGGAFENEIHINADIAFCAWWFARSTGDAEFLANEGGELIAEVARFFASRCVWNDIENRAEIRGVIPPDEHAWDHYKGLVDNSAMTNVYAAHALAAGAELSGNLVSDAERAEWRRLAEAMWVPRDAESGLYLEYEGYDGHPIKQADVGHIFFPIPTADDAETIRRNVEFYAERERETGLFIGHSPFVYGAALSRAGDVEGVRRCLVESARMTSGQFEAPRESNFGGGPFVTAAGAFLGLALYGLLGIENCGETLAAHPCLSPEVGRLSISGLTFRGRRWRVAAKPGCATAEISDIGPAEDFQKTPQYGEKTMKAKHIAKAFLAILFGAIGTAANAATFYVDADAGDDANNSGAQINDAFRTISHALTFASANDVVELAAGTYTPSKGEAFPINVPAFVTVRGAGIFETIVSPRGNATVFMLDAADGAVVERLTVEEISSPTADSADNLRAFQFVNGGSALVRDVCIRKNYNRNGSGYTFRINNASPVIRNCLVAGNTAGRLVYVSGWESNPSFENCTFYGNFFGDNSGFEDGETTFLDCVFWRNHRSVEAHSLQTAHLTVSNSVVGSISGSGLTSGNNNTDADPQFFNGYFAPQTAAGQGFDGATVDAGSRSVAEAELVGYTTRIDGVADAGTVDIGFHYPPGTLSGGDVFVSKAGDDETGDGSFASPFRTLTRGLRGAVHGTTVRVGPGTYQDETFPITPPDGTRLVGEDMLSTIIRYGGGGSHNQVVALRGGGSLKLEGFTITGATDGDYSCGVFIYGAGVDVRDCIITRNIGRENYGGLYCERSMAKFNNMLVTANFGGGGSWSSRGGGMNFIFSFVRGCNLTVVGNFGPGGNGLFARDLDGNSQISDSIIFGNGCSDVSGWNFWNLKNCLIGDGAFNGENGNFAGDPLFSRGYFLSKISAGDAEDSPCLDAGDATAAERGVDAYSATRDGVADSGVADLGFHLPAGIGAGPELFVDVNADDNSCDGLSPQTAVKNISAALDRASLGSIIHVAAGEYSRDTEDYTPFDLPDGVGIIGAGWETTTISARGTTGCFRLNGTGNGLIEGFTLRDGEDGDGASGIILFQSRALIQNCRITRNVGQEYAGGIHCAEGSSPIVRNCIIDLNRNAKTDNWVHGGGISLSYGRPVVENCTIISNNVGAANNNGGISVITDVRKENRATIRNNIIRDNSTGAPGGSDDIAIWSDVWQMEDWAFNFYYHNNHIGDGTFDGVNANFAAAPVFKDVANADYRLAQDSPGLNAGANQPWMIGATDIAGNPRIENKRVDVGAFENTYNMRTLLIIK